jgi:fibronectin-binding autotransporter adhesin
MLRAGISSTGAAGSVTNGPFGTGVVTVGSGFTLDLNGFNLANALNLSGAGIGNNGALINSGASATASGAVTIAANNTSIGGTGAITFSGAISASTHTVIVVNGAAVTAENTSNNIASVTITNSALILKTTAALTVNASALSGSTTLQTVSADKDITVSGAITNNTNANVLTLMASRDVYVNSSISGSSGKSLEINLYSDIDKTGAGGVKVSAVIGTFGANVTMRGGTGDASSTCAASYSCISGNANGNTTGVGVWVATGGSVNAGGGNIAMFGVGNSVNTSNGDGVRIESSGDVLVTSGTGTITVNGVATGGHNGVRIVNSNLVAGTGLISITGTTNSASSYDGVRLEQYTSGTMSITSDGALTINGTGGSAHYGVWIYGAGNFTVGGDISIAGQNASRNWGVVIANKTIRSNSGNISVTAVGTGGFELTSSLIAGNHASTPTSGGSITINSTGNTSYGINLSTGVILAHGTIEITTTGSGQHAFYMNGTGAKIQSASDITISATQGTWGLTMYNNSLIQSSGGNISITSNGSAGGMEINGTGGILASSATTNQTTTTPLAGGSLTISATGASQQGINMPAGTFISFGAMSITARSAGNGRGMAVAGSGIFRAVGNITIDSATSGAEWGFTLESGRAMQSTTGNISITAVGNFGMYVDGTFAASASTTDTSATTVPATGGSITISATGRTQQGLEIGAGSLFANKVISITGSATGNHHGVKLSGAGGLLKAVGDIGISASTTGAAWVIWQQNSRLIQSTTGNIAITATALAGYGIYMLDGGLVAGNSTTSPTAGGNITINSLSSADHIMGAGLRLDGENTKILAYGDISIYANGAALGLSTANQQGHGIILWGGSQVVRSFNGAISMTGYANRVAGGVGGWANDSAGITLYSGGVTVRAKNNLTLNGVSQLGIGLYLTYASGTGGGITSDTGNIVMNGLSNSSSSGAVIIRLPVTATLGSVTISGAGQGYGYYQDAWQGDVSAKTDVNIIGHANAGDGIYVNIGSISSSHGNVILSGTTTSTNTAHYGIESTRSVSAANGSVTFQAAKLDTVTTLANAIISRNTNSRPDPYFAIADSSNMASAASVGLNWTGAVTANSSTGYISINAKAPSITGAMTAYGVNLLADNQSYTLNSTSNSINTLAADIGTGSLTFINSGVLNIGSYNGVTGIAATGLTLTAGGLTDTDDAGITTTSSSTITINNASGSHDYSGVIAGPVALTKSGNGTQTLSGNNTYTGATSITAGTLVAANSGALGTSAGGISITSGATLALQGGITIADAINTASGAGVGSLGAILNNSGSNTITGLVTLGAATTIGSTAGTLTLDVASSNALTGTHNLTFTGDGNITVADPIATSTGTLTKSGVGTLTLSGNNTYTGATSITAGTLVAANSGAVGTSAGGVSITSGATLALQGGITIADAINTASGAGVGSLGAILNNSGSNTITGLVTLGAATTIGSTAGTLTLDVASSNALTGTHNLTFTGDGNITVADPIATSTGTLTKSGVGTLTLSGNNTYTGATSITAGTLVAANIGAVGTSAGGVSITSGATLALQGGITIADAINTASGAGVGSLGAILNNSGSNTITGLVTLGAATTIGSTAGTLTFNVASSNAFTGTHNLLFTGAGDITVADPIATSTASLTKEGVGNLVLSGNNTYTGDTNISAGTLRLTGSLSSSTDVLMTNSAVWDLQSAQTIATLTMASGNSITNAAGSSSLAVSGQATLANSNCYC